MDEQEFFYSQETGGTIVSSALKLMNDVVEERYDPAQWNIYAAQASDGDNWADDSPLCHELLAKKILPMVRYYSYIEITRRAHQTLWREYEDLQAKFDNFAMQHIREPDDIYPVFRELFLQANRVIIKRPENICPAVFILNELKCYFCGIQPASIKEATHLNTTRGPSAVGSASRLMAPG